MQDDDLRDYTDVQLLRELMRRHGHQPAPVQTTYFTPHREVIVGIGVDHTATLRFDDDALMELSTKDFVE